MKNNRNSLVCLTLLFALFTTVCVWASGEPTGSDAMLSAQAPVGGRSAIPLAFASVSFDGTTQSATANITSSYNSTTGLYEFTIKNTNFARTNFTTVATVSGYNGFPQGALFVNTDDNGAGKLIVGLRDVNGNLHQADFQVVVFRTH
jgi:hypothetical protein